MGHKQTEAQLQKDALGIAGWLDLIGEEFYIERLAIMWRIITSEHVYEFTGVGTLRSVETNWRSWPPVSLQAYKEAAR